MTKQARKPYYLVKVATNEYEVGHLLNHVNEGYDFINAEVGNVGQADEIRKCLVASLHPDTWIVKAMTEALHQANQKHFGYDLGEWTAPTQITYYTRKGDFYDWHIDGNGFYEEAYGMRKLSISLLLSNPSEYSGGEFDIQDGSDTYTLKPDFATAIVFPSFYTHRVRPVTSGKRISLVNWMGGPAFK